MKKLVLAVVVLALLATAIPMGMGVSTASAAAGTKWAILISGGLNPEANSAAFWNDIGETYQILVGKYGYDPANVFVLYADGNPPTAANCYSGKTSRGYLIRPYPYPTDIIDGSATSANVLSVCQYIADRDGPDDTLYVFMTDHGAASYDYAMWGEMMTPSTFASYVDLIDNINWRAFVMDFCHSEGFSVPLRRPGYGLPTLIACACGADEGACSNSVGYGAFSYNFNAALRGRTPDYVSYSQGGGAVDADLNDDGVVTLPEAYTFAEFYITHNLSTFYCPMNPNLNRSPSLLDEVLVLGQPFNDYPVADAGGPGYYSGDVGAPISFDGSASHDSDGRISWYGWDFGSGAKADHAYTSAGFYTATLTVWDDEGASDNDTVGVRVGSEVVTCDAEGNPRHWFSPGETVYVKGTWFEPNRPYCMWIQDDLVLEGDPLVSGEDPSASREQVTTASADGCFGPVGIWTVPSTSTGVGYHVYDVVVDNMNSGRYNRRYDGLASFSVTTEGPAAVIDGCTMDEDSQLTIAAPGVLGNDYDLAGRELTAALASGPSHGTLTLDLDGSFTYTPDANYNGNDTFTYTANYGEFTSNTATVTIAVLPVDDAPVSVNDGYTMDEDTVLTVDVPGVLANDTDLEGDPLAVTVLHQPEWGELTMKPDGYFIYTPIRDFSGVDSFTYRAEEREGPPSDVATVTINVNAVNDAPAARSDSYSVEATGRLDVGAPGVLANDTDVEGGTLTAVLLQGTACGYLNFNGEDGSFIYRPREDFNGVDSFVYAAYDGQAYSSGNTPVTITVTAEEPALWVANHIPDRTTAEDAGFSYTFPEDTFDVAQEGDTLNYTATLAGGNHLPDWLTFDPATRAFAGTPGNADVGLIKIIVTATDQEGAAAADCFHMTVLNVNDAPTVAIPIPNQAATEDTAFGYAFRADTFNEVDVGDSLTYEATLDGGSPLPGWLSFDAATGRFTGTPANADVGVVTVAVTATDHYGASASDSFDVAVINMNRAPAVANPLPTLEEPEGRDFTYTLPADTFEDVDPGDSLTYSAELGNSGELPNWLEFDAESATFYGSPDFSSADDYKIAVTATDAKGESVSTVLRINVLNVNRPPGLRSIPGTQTNSEGDSVYLSIQASDPDGDTVEFRVTGLPPDLAFDETTGVISGTWGAGSAGSYILAVTVSDGEFSTFLLIPWTVNEANGAPLAVDDAGTTNEDTPVTIDVLANDSDPDGDPLTAVKVTDPADGILTLNADGSFSYAPNAGFTGSDTFTYVASDGTADSNVAKVTITVNPANHAPVANDDSAVTCSDSPVIIDVLANDSDVDGNLITGFADVANYPSYGILEYLGNGLFWYSPAAGSTDPDSFSYRIRDTSGLADLGTVTIQISDLVHPPVAGTDSTVTAQDTAVTIDVAANDTDEDGNLDPTTTVATTFPGHGTTTNNGDGTITYTPESGYNGMDRFLYRICDTGGIVATSEVTVQVGSINHPPVANTDYVVAYAGIPVTFDVTTNDTDMDGNLDPTTVVVDFSFPPEHGTLTNNGDGTFTYYPGSFSSDGFGYYIYDTLGAGGWATVVITITDPDNQPPVANDDSVSTAMNTPVDIDVLANDTDEDGNLVRQSISVVLEPEHGSVEYSADFSNCFTYTPGDGYSGFDAFTYQIADTYGLTDTAVVTIKVGTANYRPVADDQAVSLDEDSLVEITLTGSDEDGDTLYYTVVKLPDYGELSGSGAVFTYTPAANYRGIDVFTFRVNDGELDSGIAIVTITVNAVNDAPVAQDCGWTTDEDAVLTVGAPGVLAFVTDYDADPLTAKLVSEPLHGTLVLNTDGSFTYTPNTDYWGADSFSYMANDGEADSEPATVTITLVFVNDAPVAQDDSITAYSGVPVTIDVATNDFDMDGNLDPTSVWAILGPVNGTVLAYGDGRFEYTSDTGFSGIDTFTYEIRDHYELSDTAVVTIAVNMINPPVADDQAVTTDEDNAVGITLMGSDVDGDLLTYTIVTLPAHGTVTGSGADLTYTPDANFDGADSFTFRVNDGMADSNVATVTITVNAANDTPTIANPIPDQNAAEGAAFIYTFPANTFNNVDIGDSLTYAATLVASLPLPTWLSFDAGTRTFSGSPDYSSAGVYDIEVTATDQSGASGSDTFKIAVVNVNRAPEAVDPGLQTDSEGDSVHLQIRASDPDGDVITFTATAPPPGLTFDAATGVIGGTWDYNSAGSYNMLVTVSDNDPTDPRSASITILWVVNNTNRPPIADDQAVTTDQEMSLAITLTGSDVDGDTLNFIVVDGPAHGSLSGAAPNLIYAPEMNYNGTDSFTFRTNDGELDSNLATVTFTITAVAHVDSYAFVFSSANPSTYGQRVTLLAVVLPGERGFGMPTGTVTFKDGEAILGTGTLTPWGLAGYSTSSLSPGRHLISVVYAGDDTFNGSTSPVLSQRVKKASTTKIVSSANPSVSGRLVTFTATVSAAELGAGTPAGTVTFKDGGRVLGTAALDPSGQASYSTRSLSVGTHSITAVYNGDGDYAGSTSSVLTQKVKRA